MDKVLIGEIGRNLKESEDIIKCLGNIGGVIENELDIIWEEKKMCEGGNIERILNNVSKKIKKERSINWIDIVVEVEKEIDMMKRKRGIGVKKLIEMGEGKIWKGLEEKIEFKRMERLRKGGKEIGDIIEKVEKEIKIGGNEDREDDLKKVKGNGMEIGDNNKRIVVDIEIDRIEDEVVGNEKMGKRIVGIENGWERLIENKIRMKENLGNIVSEIFKILVIREKGMMGRNGKNSNINWGGEEMYICWREV